jgi:hypothetical protein
MLLAGVFLFAGITKLRGNLVDFQRLLDAVGLRSRWGLSISRVLLVVELALAIWLLNGWESLAALLCAIITLVLFLSMAAKALRGGYTGSCYCFGSTGRRLGYSTLIFDFALISIALIAAIISRGADDLSVSNTQPKDIIVLFSLFLWLAAVYFLVTEMELVARSLNQRRRSHATDSN